MTACICMYFPSYVQKTPSSKRVIFFSFKNGDYKKTKKHKRCLCGSAHCLYSDIIKLCIQNPVVMEFHSRMGTVNATTMNVGRLLHKGQLSHRDAGRLTGDQQTNTVKGIMSLISTLTPPHMHTPRKTSYKITCYPFPFKGKNLKETSSHHNPTSTLKIKGNNKYFQLHTQCRMVEICWNHTPVRTKLFPIHMECG